MYFSVLSSIKLTVFKSRSQISLETIQTEVPSFTVIAANINFTTFFSATSSSSEVAIVKAFEPGFSFQTNSMVAVFDKFNSATFRSRHDKPVN